MGAAEHLSAANVSQLVSSSGVDLLLSDLLSTNNGGELVFASSRPLCLTYRASLPPSCCRFFFLIFVFPVVSPSINRELTVACKPKSILV